MDEEQKKKCVLAEVVVLLILLMIEGVLVGVSLDLQQNLWLGKEASVWEFMKERRKASGGT